MMIETHSHILPRIDDGSDSLETSRRMIEQLRKQGVSRIYATPHFYAHREKSLEDFLEKRQTAWEELNDKEILLGAEIALEMGISEIDGIEKLAYQGTDLILLEFPYRRYENWMENEILYLTRSHRLVPVIAHISRYIDLFSPEQLKRVLGFDAIFQINNEAFTDRRQAKFVKKIIKSGCPIIFGSDSHNMTLRKPNWDVLRQKCKPEVISAASQLFEKHLVNEAKEGLR